MASDERDTDERESDERRGESGADASDGVARYANAGREASDVRQQAWRAGDPNRSPAGERPPEGRRYGSEGRPASERPGRRYGSRPPGQRGPPGHQGPPSRQGPPEQQEPPNRQEPPIRRPGDRGRGPPAEEPPSTGRQPSGEPEVRPSEPEGRPPEPRDESEPSEPRESPEQSDARGGTERSTPDEGRSEPGEGTEPQSRTGPETPPKRTQPMREPSEPRQESLDEGEGEEVGGLSRYGGPLDPNWGHRSASERERAQREYERRMDRKWDQQRRFQVDKSGNRYRRR